jgi:hypothetical protein
VFEFGTYLNQYGFGVYFWLHQGNYWHGHVIVEFYKWYLQINIGDTN